MNSPVPAYYAHHIIRSIRERQIWEIYVVSTVLLLRITFVSLSIFVEQSCPSILISLINFKVASQHITNIQITVSVAKHEDANESWNTWWVETVTQGRLVR